MEEKQSQLDKENEEPQHQKTYTYDDLLKFENPQIYSAFGRMLLSGKNTNPRYGFGTADRNKQQKAFQNKEVAKKSFLGQHSPGPAYNPIQAEIEMRQKVPQWKFGTQERNTLNTGAKFDYYQRPDIDFNPDDANLRRREKEPVVRIGLEPRFQGSNKRIKGTPGPQYDPSQKPEYPNASKYSFGYRRDVKGQSFVSSMGCTPELVGPGSYLPKGVPKTSKLENEPRFSFPKAPKQALLNSTFDKHQTYDRQQSIGRQVTSKRQTTPSYSMGKASRSHTPGIFKSDMSTQLTRLRLDHPKY